MLFAVCVHCGCSLRGFLAHLSQRLRMSYSITPHPSSVRPSSLFNNFSENPGPFFLKFHMEPSVKGELKSYYNGHDPLSKIVAMPIYGKKNTLTLKNLLLQNQASFEAESWYIALGTQGLPCFFKWCS